MTWLKKIGTVVLKIIGIASGLLPLVAPAVQTATGGSSTAAAITDRLTSAFSAVITAEQMLTAANGADAKTGSQKLAAASPFVGALVQDVLKQLTSKAAPKDPQKLETAITTITGALADALNAYGD